jgi:hypothetical protein
MYARETSCTFIADVESGATDPDLDGSPTTVLE